MPIDTVQTEETPKTPESVFAEARASLSTQSDDTDHAPQEETPATDDTVSEEEPPAEDTDEAADQPQETAESDDTVLTDDEIARLSPKEQANARKWQAKLTQKSQAIAAQAKEFAQWKPLIDAFSADPQAALSRVAEQLGFAVSKKGLAAAADAVADELPPEMESLRPYLESYKSKLLSTVQSELAPVRSHQEQLRAEAAAAETQSTLEAFTAKYPEWKKYEAKMVEIGKRISPASDVTSFEYMETLYTLATAGLKQIETTKKTVDRINKAAKASEPQTSGAPPERVSTLLPPPDKRGIRDAFEAAKRGEVWGG